MIPKVILGGHGLVFRVSPKLGEGYLLGAHSSKGYCNLQSILDLFVYEQYLLKGQTDLVSMLIMGITGVSIWLTGVMLTIIRILTKSS